jgi:hypothetical protein
MDLEKLGAVSAQAIRHETVTPFDVVSPLDDQELMQAVHERGLLVGEAATGLAMHEAEAPEEVDPETEKRLEALNPDFAEVVKTRYAEKYAAVDGYISDGKLPEAYRLPSLGELMDRVEAVAPAYEAINSVADGQVGFDFAPQDLTDEQKTALATGHTLPNGQTTTGAYNYNADREITDPTNPSADESLWDTAVMDVSETPAIRGISADGSKTISGVKREPILLALADIRDGGIGLAKLRGSKKGLSAEELLICQLSPSEDTKFGIQLGRLERGEQPLDSNGIWTIGKENVKVGDAVRSVFSYFDAYDRELCSDGGDRGYAYGGRVVRLSARGKDLIPRS